MLRYLGLGLLFVVLAACGGKSVTVFDEQNIPNQLSQWGVLELNDGYLQLGEDVQPYDLNSGLFTDYAHKLRTVWLPNGERPTVKADGDTLDFPVGSIISKTFYYPKSDTVDSGDLIKIKDSQQFLSKRGLNLAKVRLVETRLLVHQPGGWQAISYVWDAEQTQAARELAGEFVQLKFAGKDQSPFTYVVPDQNQCAGCHVTDHASKQLQPIGLKIRHLDKPSTYEQGSQLMAILGEDRDQNSPWVPALAQWHNPKAQLSDRARGYLDINCGHCHNATGAADTSGLLLDSSSTKMRQLGVCKPPVAAGRGTGNRHYGIAPGDADQSIIIYRMRATKPGDKMPELGRTLVHTEGIELISEWIDSMPKGCT